MQTSRIPEDIESSAPSLNPWGRNQARIISFVSQKGGVGKTTSAVNLGATFALTGHRVLLIGLDPQCGLSRSLGYDPDTLHGGLRDVLLGGVPLETVIHGTTLDDLSLVSPDACTLSEEEQYKQSIAKPNALSAALQSLRGDFDTILIDCPPGFGSETRAALAASDSYLIPVQAEELCRDSIPRLLDFIREFEDLSHRNLILEGLFLTMTDSRTRMSRHVSDELSDEFGDLVYEHPVPRTTRLAEMAIKGRPTVIFDRRSPGSRAYFDLMDDILLRHLSRPQPEIEALPQPGSMPEPAPRPIDVPESESVIPSISGLSQLMKALSAAAPAAETSPDRDPAARYLDPAPEEGLFSASDEPDLVSLDDLLEEEERASRPRYEEDDWSLGDDSLGSIN